MSSTNYPDDLHIERDLPTTEADVEAQHRLRHNRGLTLREALDLLSTFDLFPLDAPNRVASSDWEPFQL